ncbi:Ca(2+)-dependent cysteine protease [Blastocladiella emersonii ATCC 22665]|nr:Ca(2+)-dependent cysteine protease [Blastocladiella emersonii ATCC 22665]
MGNKARCFGLSYPTGQGANPIPGCDVDADNMGKIARMMGIQDVVVYKDDEAPITRAQILGALEDMVYNACAGDTLLFSYAGHGGQTKDESGDEYDGADEFLVCADGMILDDEVRALLACLPAGCRMVLVFDCCHSGTMVDLENNTHELQAEIVALSAALDSQESMGFTTGGVFTSAIMRVLAENNGISWIDAVPLIDEYDNMRSQKPVLSTNIPGALYTPAFAPVGTFTNSTKGSQFASNVNPFASAEEQKQDAAAPAPAAAEAAEADAARKVPFRGYPYFIPYAGARHYQGHPFSNGGWGGSRHYQGHPFSNGGWGGSRGGNPFGPGWTFDPCNPYPPPPPMPSGSANQGPPPPPMSWTYDPCWGYGGRPSWAPRGAADAKKNGADADAEPAMSAYDHSPCWHCGAPPVQFVPVPVPVPVAAAAEPMTNGKEAGGARGRYVGGAYIPNYWCPGGF